MAGHHPVIQHIGGNALAVQHPGDGRAFVVSLHAVPAARADHHGSPRAFRRKRGQGRLGLIRAVSGIGCFPRPKIYFFFHDTFLSFARKQTFSCCLYFTPFWQNTQFLFAC